LEMVLGGMECRTLTSLGERAGVWEHKISMHVVTLGMTESVSC
jgi:hypothetical protein